MREPNDLSSLRISPLVVALARLEFEERDLELSQKVVRLDVVVVPHLDGELVRGACDEGEGLVVLGVEVVVDHLGLANCLATGDFHVRIGAVPKVYRLVLSKLDTVCVPFILWSQKRRAF